MFRTSLGTVMDGTVGAVERVVSFKLAYRDYLWQAHCCGASPRSAGSVLWFGAGVALALVLAVKNAASGAATIF